MTLDEEANRTTQLLKHKTFDVLWRHREDEVIVQFTDGTRLFIEHTAQGLELSITGNANEP